MSEVKPKNFYPENGITDSGEVNANYNAFEGSLGANDINNENVRTEGIDLRNLGQRPIHKYIGQLNNGYLLSIGDVPAAGARYQSYSVDVNEPKEVPINHDSSGSTSTSIGDGTKLRVNGTAGASFEGGEVIHISWNVNMFTNFPHTPLNELVTKLIDTATKDGGTGASHPYGSGIGEWCWLVYPKFNTTSSALNDSDFEDATDAGLDTGAYLDPSAITGTNSIGNNHRTFDDFKWDHVMVMPSVFFSAGNVSTSPYLLINSAGSTTGGSAAGALGGPQMFNGSFSLKVKDNVTDSLRLYGIQLYISGYWRMHGNTNGTGSPMNNGMFLEYEICNPSRTNTDGDPIPLYGVEGEVGLERVQTHFVIYTTAGS